MFDFVVDNLKEILGIIGGILAGGLTFRMASQIKGNRIKIKSKKNSTGTGGVIIDAEDGRVGDINIDNRKTSIIYNNGMRKNGDDGVLYVILSALFGLGVVYFYMRHGFLVIDFVYGLTFLNIVFSAIYFLAGALYLGFPVPKVFAPLTSFALAIGSYFFVLPVIQSGYHQSYADFAIQRNPVRVLFDLPSDARGWILSQIFSIVLVIVASILSFVLSISNYLKDMLLYSLIFLVLILAAYCISLGNVANYLSR